MHLVRLTEGWRQIKWSKLALPFWIRVDNADYPIGGLCRFNQQRSAMVLDMAENNHVSAAVLCNSGLTRKLEKLRPIFP
jgi:hypothetical protein